MSKLNTAADLSLIEFADEYGVDSCPEHIFSDKFERGMDKIIKKSGGRQNKIKSLNKKTFVILIAAATALALTVTAGAIKQGGIDKFIKYGFSSHIKDDDNAKSKENEKPAVSNGEQPRGHDEDDNDADKIRGKKLPAEFAPDNNPEHWKYRITDEESKTITLTKYSGKTKNLKIPAKLDGYSITEIDSFAFCNNKKLKMLRIAGAVTELNPFAVYNCVNLKKLVIENGVKVFNEKAVGYYCDEESDEDIVLPDLIISCGRYSAAYKYALENSFMFEVDEIPEMPEWEYRSVYGGIEITGYNREESNVLIPYKINGKTVKSIASGAFADNTFVSRVVVLKNVKTINDGAFCGCANLNAIYLHGEATRLSPMALAFDFKIEDDQYTEYRFNDGLTIVSSENSEAYAYSKQFGLEFTKLLSDSSDSDNDGSSESVSSEQSSASGYVNSETVSSKKAEKY